MRVVHMVETLYYSKLYTEDFDVGDGSREVRLADGRGAMLRQVNIGRLLAKRVLYLRPTNNAAVITSSGALRQGWRVFGVTIKVTRTFGTTNSLSRIDIGDTVTVNRWGANIQITQDTETSQSDFQAGGSDVLYTANTDLIVTAVGGNFDATGEVEVFIHYLTISHE